MVSFLEEQLDLLGSFRQTPATRREIIKNYLPELIEGNYSRNRARELFREKGLGIRKEDFKRIYDEIRYNKYADVNIIYLPKNEPINERHMNISRNNFGGRYMYIMDYGVLNEDNGTIERRQWGLVSNDRLSKEEIISRILDKMSEFDSPPRESIAGANINKVFINPDL